MSFKPHGIVPAMITPIYENGGVNEGALRKLIDYLIQNGVHGIFAAGTTGEFYALDQNEFRTTLEICKDQIAGRVPLYGGASSITTREAVKLAQIAQEVGVDALSVLTPMFITPNQDQLYHHYKAVCESVDLPIIAYNNQPKTGVPITPATVVRLAEIKNMVGIKDSTGDLTNTGEYIRLTKDRDFAVMMGRDTMIYAGLCYGAAGAVAACANVAPALMVKIYDCYQKGDHQGALQAQYQLAPLRIAFGVGTFPAVIKEALELLGIEVGPCAAPVGPFNDEERSYLKNVLQEMELLS